MLKVGLSMAPRTSLSSKYHLVLLAAALVLSGCEAGPTTAYDTLPQPGVASEFGQITFATRPLPVRPILASDRLRFKFKTQAVRLIMDLIAT